MAKKQYEIYRGKLLNATDITITIEAPKKKPFQEKCKI